MVININGIIGDQAQEGEDNTLNSEALNTQLATLPNETEPVTVKINSVGGSVFEGFTMFNALKALANPVTTEINGMAASIASLIALAGSPVNMSQVSMFMIHRASTMAMGNQEELEKQAEVLKSIDDTLINVYAEKTGLPTNKIENMLSDETWLTSEQALAKGFVDEIINKVSADMAALYKTESNTKIMKLKSLFASFKNETEEVETTTEVVETTELSAEEIEAKKGEDDPDKKKEDPDMKYVTQAQFKALEAKVAKLAAATDEAIETAVDTVKEEVLEQAKEVAATELSNLKTGLKRTASQPPKANASVTGDPTIGWVDKYAGFRAEMKEIEDKTRN